MPPRRSRSPGGSEGPGHHWNRASRDPFWDVGKSTGGFMGLIKGSLGEEPKVGKRRGEGDL